MGNVVFTTPLGHQPQGPVSKAAARWTMRLMIFAVWFFTFAVTVALPPLVIITGPIATIVIVRRIRRGKAHP